MGYRYLGKDKQGRDRWQVWIYVGKQVSAGTGKVLSAYDRRTITGTERDAKALERSMLNARDEGAQPGNRRLTLGDYLSEWHRTKARGTLGAKTWAVYGSNLKRHILPGLGHLKLADLTVQDLDAFYTDKLRAGLAPATIRKLHNLLSRALGDAVKARLIRVNAARDATPPRVPKPKHTTLDDAEIDRLLAVAKKAKDRFYPLFHLAAFTGLSRGELLGLRWRSVDLDRGALYVTATYRWADSEEHFVIDEGQAKTDSRLRAVPLDPETVEVLRRHKKEQEWIKESEGDRYIDRDLVFAMEHGGPPDPINILRRHLYPLEKAAGVPKASLHELRHSHATNLLKANTHPKIVQERLGHRSITTTLDLYSHATPAMQKQALDAYFAQRAPKTKRRAR